MSKIGIFAFVLLVVVFNTYGFEHKLKADNKFANIFLKSSSVIDDSPQRSLECFATYIPKLNELTNKYEAEYETCLKRSVDAQSVIEGEVQMDRDNLENSATQICGGFQHCSSESTNSYKFFECYNSVAGETTKTAYNIQNVSKDKMEFIKVKYETIKYDQNRCTDQCSRLYVEDSAKIYGDLDKCLDGTDNGPSVATTPEPTTIYTTTRAPSTEPNTTEEIIPTPPECL